MKAISRVWSLFIGFTLISFSAVAAQTHKVEMKSISFAPKQLSVKVGDLIVWKNVSYTQHSATTSDEAPANLKFDSGLISPKDSSKPIEFKQPGTIEYHCSVHGKTMSGTITVTP